MTSKSLVRTIPFRLASSTARSRNDNRGRRSECLKLSKATFAGVRLCFCGFSESSDHRYSSPPSSGSHFSTSEGTCPLLSSLPSETPFSEVIIVFLRLLSARISATRPDLTIDLSAPCSHWRKTPTPQKTSARMRASGPAALRAILSSRAPPRSAWRARWSRRRPARPRGRYPQDDALRFWCLGHRQSRHRGGPPLRPFPAGRKIR